DRAQHEMTRVLVGARRAAVPGVVGDVDEEVGARAPVAAREIRERRLVADEHAETARRRGKYREPAPDPEPPEPPEVEPARWHKGHALDHRHEIVLRVHGMR